MTVSPPRAVRYLIPCPGTAAVFAAVWLLWAQSTPTPTPTGPIAAHLAGCPRCRTDPVAPGEGPQLSPALCPGMRSLLVAIGRGDPQV
jgi:hypothetical protein